MDINPTETGYEHVIRIPQERIAVLIGNSGSTKRDFEQHASVLLDIDSKEGTVLITGEDAVNVMIASDMVRAVARGFNPVVAKSLLKTDVLLSVINIMDFARNQHDSERLRGRVIGEGGKSRRTIEDLTGASISVYGKTVSIIGESVGLDHARRAVTMLLEGSPHRNVYKWLEGQRKSRVDAWLQ